VCCSQSAPPPAASPPAKRKRKGGPAYNLNGAAPGWNTGRGGRRKAELLFSGAPEACGWPQGGEQLVFRERQVEWGEADGGSAGTNLARPVWIAPQRGCISSEMITLWQLEEIDFT